MSFLLSLSLPLLPQSLFRPFPTYGPTEATGSDDQDSAIKAFTENANLTLSLFCYIFYEIFPDTILFWCFVALLY